MKSDELLEKYLKTELKMSGVILFMTVEKLKKYDDIYNEFCRWLENRNYDIDNPIVVAGYTAKQIHELNPGFEGIGVYNFMITLRDHPERAKKYIESGFKEL